LNRWLQFTIAVTALVLVAAAVTAQAASEPDNVAAEVRDAAKQCRAAGGKPNTEAMLRAVDFTGKGGPDWIIDYSKLQCERAANPFCGTGGCALQFYFWSPGSKWVRVFDQNVRGYHLIRVAGRPALRVTMGGAACGKINAGDCVFVFKGDNLRRRLRLR
jgi:hypothetical protein